MDITRPNPLDVSAVRDPGMQSLIILAASLGWNVHQKQNQPVVITARDGVQKRLPTNTSIRMGVFQSALSTVLAHTDEDHVPTPQLIDGIIAVTKPSVEHARRLRIAIGESPAQHRDRVAAHAAESKGSPEPQPLTQRIEFPVAEEQAPARAATEDSDLSVASLAKAALPADDGDHGVLLTMEPFQAIRQVVRAGNSDRVHTYQSDTSWERVWFDGYKDYACVECGKAFPTPKGVGAHSQTHGKKEGHPAWQRVRQAGLSEVIVTRTVPPTPEPEIVEPEEVAAPAAVEPIEPPLTDEEWQPFAEATGIMPAIDSDPLFVLGQITALVAPELIKERDELRAQVEALIADREAMRAERDATAANLQALKEMIGGL